jgi:hypothetical protein
MQVSLFGEVVPESRGPSSKDGDDCDIRCLKASEPRCVCRCRGRNHGYLNAVKNESLDGERYLALGHVKELFEFFREKACLVCGYPHLEVLGYPHPDGIYLKQYDMRIWVFGRCLRCGYDNAFWKFSLPRARAALGVT